MADLIDRQMAIDAVKEYFKFSPLEGRQCAKAIERVPSAQPDKDLIHLQKEQAYMQGYADGQKPRKWISVSERLPDIKENHVSEPCIVYCENGAYGFTELEENIFGQVRWYCEREDEFHEPLGKVLAWMPLPDPWKEEE